MLDANGCTELQLTGGGAERCVLLSGEPQGVVQAALDGPHERAVLACIVGETSFINFENLGGWRRWRRRHRRNGNLPSPDDRAVAVSRQERGRRVLLAAPPASLSPTAPSTVPLPPTPPPLLLLRLPPPAVDAEGLACDDDRGDDRDDDRGATADADDRLRRFVFAVDSGGGLGDAAGG